jgi:tetratricopeptide (TPR) repeat protein
VRWIQRLSIPALALLLVGGSQVAAAEAGKKPFKESPSFGLFRQAEPEAARSQALAWLQQSGKADSATLKSFEQVWSSDKSVLDKISATFQLGSPEAAKLLAEARDPETPAPTAVPKIIKDSKLPRYFRANLGLAYGKALANRKVYEEALDALKAVKPEDVIDPSAYFFHRAVCEHALMYRAEADETIDKLLQDVVDAPERYRQVAWLMHYDMASWSDKGLDWIARRMNMIKDRLDLTRGGPKTRKMQREVLVKLDEKIKELENKAKSGGT